MTYGRKLVTTLPPYLAHVGMSPVSIEECKFAADSRGRV